MEPSCVESNRECKVNNEMFRGILLMQYLKSRVIIYHSKERHKSFVMTCRMFCGKIYVQTCETTYILVAYVYFLYIIESALLTVISVIINYHSLLFIMKYYYIFYSVFEVSMLSYYMFYLYLQFLWN